MNMYFKFEDRCEIAIPVFIVANSRAKYYESSFESFDASLKETNDLFDACEYEAFDWLLNNMKWEEFSDSIAIILGSLPFDFQSRWKEITFLGFGNKY